MLRRRSSFWLSCVLVSLASYPFAGCVPDLAVLSGTGAGTSTAAQGGVGGSPPCEPNTEETCYSGVVGTEGVGVCTPGTKVCASDGQSYGECSGSGGPSLENCSSEEDENCDGEPGCIGKCMWTRRFAKRDVKTGGSEFAIGLGGVAVDGQWNAFVAGGYNGATSFSGAPVDFGDGDLACKSQRCGFIAKFDALGAHSWSRSIEGYPAESVHVLKSGKLVVTAQAGGPFSLECGLGGVDYWNTVVFMLDPDKKGECVSSWGSLLGGKPVRRPGVAVDKDGAVYLALTLETGGTILDTYVGAQQSALVRLRPQDGGIDWVRLFGGINFRQAGIAVDASGSLFVVGDAWAGSTVTFGPKIAFKPDHDEMLVARFDPPKNEGDTGNWTWVSPMGAQDRAWSGDILLTAYPNEGLFVAGSFETEVQPLGKCGPLAMARGLVVAKIDITNGECLQATAFPTSGIDLSSGQYTRLRADITGQGLLLSGSYTSSAQFQNPLPSSAKTSIFVAKLDGALTPIWSHGYGANYQDLPYGLTIDSGGSVVLAGVDKGVDFGCGAAQEDEGNFFLTRLSP